MVVVRIMAVLKWKDIISFSVQMILSVTTIQLGILIKEEIMALHKHTKSEKAKIKKQTKKPMPSKPKKSKK